MLGLLDQVRPEAAAPLAARYALDWAPVLCLAVEREPEAHPFYRALAALTRQTLFDLTRSAAPPAAIALELEEAAAVPDEEISLRDVVRHLLAPARSGVFLSRARLGGWGRALGMRLPFGERFMVALSLFEAAGASGDVIALLDLLGAEVRAWNVAYQAWAVDWPVWASFGASWQERAAATLKLLAEMRDTALCGAGWGTEDAGEND
jgi:hypothetical protein